jgi:hypothetical protein
VIPDEANGFVGAAFVNQDQTNRLVIAGEERLEALPQVFETIPVNDEYMNQRPHHSIGSIATLEEDPKILYRGATSYGKP